MAVILISQITTVQENTAHHKCILKTYFIKDFVAAYLAFGSG